MRNRKNYSGMTAGKNNVVAERLRRLRKVMDYHHANTFAAFLGIPASRWNNLENGFPLSKEVAFLLVRKIPGLSLDWLWFGRTEGLSVKLERQLREAASDE